MKSRVKGDFQARFRENVRVKFHCVTRAVRYLKTKYKEKPDLFVHWLLVHP